MIDKYYSGAIKSEDVELIADKGIYRFSEVSKSAFLKIIVDSFYVERFDIDRATEKVTEDLIITIYKTGVDTKTLLSKFGINIVDARIINDTTLRLNPDEAKLLYDNASYLIAMSITDFSKLDSEEILDNEENGGAESSIIPTPSNEPTIGVIDTLFNEKVYFHEWVEYTNMLDANIPTSPRDYDHGTAVSSIRCV